MCSDGGGHVPVIESVSWRERIPVGRTWADNGNAFRGENGSVGGAKKRRRSRSQMDTPRIQSENGTFASRERRRFAANRNVRGNGSKDVVGVVRGCRTVTPLPECKIGRSAGIQPPTGRWWPSNTQVDRATSASESLVNYLTSTSGSPANWITSAGVPAVGVRSRDTPGQECKCCRWCSPIRRNGSVDSILRDTPCQECNPWNTDRWYASTPEAKPGPVRKDGRNSGYLRVSESGVLRSKIGVPGGETRTGLSPLERVNLLSSW